MSAIPLKGGIQLRIAGVTDKEQPSTPSQPDFGDEEVAQCVDAFLLAILAITSFLGT